MRLLSEMLDEHFLCENARVSWRDETYGKTGLGRASRKRRRTAASVMTKAALLEHIWTSGSWLMIFLTLDTGKGVLDFPR